MYKRQGNINVWLPLVRPLLGTWPAPRHVPWLGIKPGTFLFAGRCSIHWSLARAHSVLFSSSILITIWNSLILLLNCCLLHWNVDVGDLRLHLVYRYISSTQNSFWHLPGAQWIFIERIHALAGVAPWIECGLQTKGLPVRFPVREHIASHVSLSLKRHIFLSLSPSLPLSKNK